jgi:hypothetical protein
MVQGIGREISSAITCLIVFIIIMAILLCLFIPGTVFIYKKGYKKGQLDYYNGIIKYEYKKTENFQKK